MVIIGIDPHKSSLTAVAIDNSGTTLATRRFVVNAGTMAGLTNEIAHLRIAMDALATTVRRHEEEIRHLRRSKS